MKQEKALGTGTQLLLAAMLVLLALPLQAAETTFTFGGYVKLDAIATDYKDGDPAVGNPIRDFHLPSLVPVGGESLGADLDFHAKESRFNLGTTTTTESGKKLKMFVEMDFLLGDQGNERVSNSYNPRLRHFFFTYDKWLFGQTWSTFMIIVLPDDLDFVGAADASTFMRQPMIRYTRGPWQFAIENPESTISPYGGGSRIVSDDGLVPDLVGRYNFKGDWGSFSVAAIVRQLGYEDGAGIDDTATGFGVSVGGKFKVGQSDDIRVQATYGGGLGRYIGLNFSNGAVLDANGQLQAIDSMGAFLAYLHHWNGQWRSSFNVSYIGIDNDTSLTGTGANEGASSYSANILYSPAPKVMVGLEYMHATRDLESGVDGAMDRIQFSAKYAFSFSGTH